MHRGMGCVVHPDVAFLGRCIVFHQVTLGDSWGSVAGCPEIGDGVVIGAGAKVLGGVSIGSGAFIGANALVTRDVPPNAIALGVNQIYVGKAPPFPTSGVHTARCPRR